MKNDKYLDKSETSSLSLAAYLYSIGNSSVVVAHLPNSRNCSFIFDITTEDFQKYSNLFWSKQTNIDALTYFEALRVIKGLMYQQRRDYGE